MLKKKKFLESKILVLKNKLNAVRMRQIVMILRPFSSYCHSAAYIFLDLVAEVECTNPVAHCAEGVKQ